MYVYNIEYQKEYTVVNPRKCSHVDKFVTVMRYDKPTHMHTRARARTHTHTHTHTQKHVNIYYIYMYAHGISMREDMFNTLHPYIHL
jgi:hypothetical protein